MRAPAVLLIVAALVGGACGDDDGTGASTSSTTIAIPPTTDTTTTSAPRPSGPAYVMYGERGAYVAALQFYLSCAGFGPLDIDGIFGDGTKAAVQAAQEAEGKQPSGEPDEESFAFLSRSCDSPRTVFFPVGETSLAVAGNAAPGDDEEFEITLEEGDTLTVTLAEGTGLDVGVIGADGVVLHRPSGEARIAVTIPDTQTYTVRVAAAAPTSYSLGLAALSAGPVGEGIVLGLDGLGVAAFGDEPDAVITILTDLLGTPAIDTDWVEGPIDEGFACLGTTRRVTWVVDAPGGELVDATLTAGFSDYLDGERAFLQWTLGADWETLLTGGGAAAVGTAEGVTVGSTFAEVAEALGEPAQCGEEQGDMCLSTEEGEVTYRFRIAADEDHDGDDRIVAEIQGGFDGCEIPEP